MAGTAEKRFALWGSVRKGLRSFESRLDNEQAISPTPPSFARDCDAYDSLA